MTYAANTSVPVERSKTEIERLLARYGADKFGYVSEAGSAAIAFQMRGRGIRMVLPLPRPEDSALSRTGRERTAEAARAEHERLMRARWRALVLICKAKLEAIESGITTFEDEWLPYTLVPGTGKTVSESIGPRLALAYEKGGTPQLLLGMEDDE